MDEDRVAIPKEVLERLNRHDADFSLLELQIVPNLGLKTKYINPEVFIPQSRAEPIGNPIIICVEGPPRGGKYEALFPLYSNDVPEGANAYTRSSGSVQQPLLGNSKEGPTPIFGFGVGIGAAQYWKIPPYLRVKDRLAPFEEVLGMYKDLRRH